jgi:hypothetical protein
LQGQRGSGQKRSARCAHDRVVRRHHADAPAQATGVGARTASRDDHRPSPTSATRKSPPRMLSHRS